MVLIKRFVEGIKEYQWINEHADEQSPWMNLSDALVWIQERDQKKNSIPQKSDPQKISIG